LAAAHGSNDRTPQSQSHGGAAPEDAAAPAVEVIDSGDGPRTGTDPVDPDPVPMGTGAWMCGGATAGAGTAAGAGAGRMGCAAVIADGADDGESPVGVFAIGTTTGG
jgi:hypothetical protein